MKYWIVKDANDVLHVVGAKGFIPNGAVCEAPEGEDVEWLDIVVDQDSFGQDLPPRAVINEVRKAQVLADRQAAKDANAWLEGRLREYPSLQDIMEALVEDAEGRPEKLAEISAARAQVKIKYPKPVGK